jgi:predicted GH43/DUF377 family glycosyl hydrolase
MKWERLGRIFTSGGQRPWMVSHASVPSPELVDGDTYRIYFTPRDAGGRSHIASLLIDIKDPTRVLDIAPEPALSPGTLGAFDDSGAMFSWIVHHEGRRWLYYIGWSLGAPTPWRTAIGLAYASGDSAEQPIFERQGAGPIIDRSTADPFFVTNPCVLREGARWRMWYLSGLGWLGSKPSPLPRYNVRYAESEDGARWTPTGRVCIDHVHPGEVAIGRPCVIAEGGAYRMFYSYRGDSFGYRMGCAESSDGLTWKRADAAMVFTGPPEPWEEQGTAYPTVFDHEGQRYMLYCGNNYSRDGFGIAALVA